MSWIWPVLGGVIAAPFGAVLGIAIAYVVLMACGVTEFEGRRGFLAAGYGLLPGLIVGFKSGYELVQWVLH